MFVRNNNDTRCHILRASACCRTSSAVKSPAVQRENVIVLISLTLMKVVSDNMADNPGLRFREPSRSPLNNQSGYKMFNNKHRNFRDHALDPEILRSNSEATCLFLHGLSILGKSTSCLTPCNICPVKMQNLKVISGLLPVY
jgi:hypothetical protein